MKPISLFLSLSLCVIMTACKHGVPVTPFNNEALCKFKRYELDLSHRLPYDPPPTITPTSDPGLLPLSDAFKTAPRSAGYRPAPYLFMSGGGPNGAFGAGILNGMAAGKTGPDGPIPDGLPEGIIGSLPDFQVVTGISTGAILSIAAFSNTPSAAKEGYRIEDESEAIEAFVKTDENGDVPDGAMLTALRKGALADLTPLMNSTRQIILDPQYCVGGTGPYAGCIMDRIARGHDTGRRMLIGVTDLETGSAIALDMGEMAQRYVSAKEDYRKNHYLECFLKGIAASSSVPLAARPIAIDNRLYIDGGARFLLFGDILGSAINDDKDGVPFMPPNVYMIINGDQEVGYKCGKKDKRDCNANPYSLKGGHKKWSLLTVVARTFDVLKTQVGEFSEAEVRRRAEDIQNGNLTDGTWLDRASLNDGPVPVMTVREARPLNANIRQPLKIENAELKKFSYLDRDWTGHQHTCEEWKKIDKATYRGIQFHKTYMRCLIAYGQDKGARWQGKN